MVLYNCHYCNFSTDKTSNYHRHLKTKKHLKKEKMKNEDEFLKKESQILDKVTNNNIKESQVNTNHSNEYTYKYPEVSTNTQSGNDKYFCQNCNKFFNHKNNYYRHIKHRCKEKIVKEDKNSIDNVSMEDYKNILERLLESQDKLLLEKEKRLQEKENNIINLMNIKNKNITNNTYNETNNTLNNTNYVFNYINYIEADSMDSIKEQFKLTRDEFIKASLTNGYKGALLDKANSIIIKPYFDREEKRPMQTVDISRKKALYKDDLNDNWTFNPKTTLDLCFKTFHNSAMEHQDKTIKEHTEPFILCNDNNLYKQTYFIPTENKEKEAIYREVRNHIYQKTKIKRNINELMNKEKDMDIITNMSEETDTNLNLEDYTKEEEYIEGESEEIIDQGKRYLYNKKNNIVYDPKDNYKYIGQREYNELQGIYYINYDV